MRDAVKGLAHVEKRRSVLATAVAVCMNDDHLTDLATLKRAWFFSETGRDEPVGSRSWEELRVMVREHDALPTILVKIADIEDNSDPERLALLDEPTRGRLKAKYGAALPILKDAAARLGWRKGNG